MCIATTPQCVLSGRQHEPLRLMHVESDPLPTAEALFRCRRRRQRLTWRSGVAEVSHVYPATISDRIPPDHPGYLLPEVSMSNKFENVPDRIRLHDNEIFFSLVLLCNFIDYFPF
jgi:hypothetical protein